MPGRILRVLQKETSSLINVKPVLVALGSIPRKKECMSISPELDLAIATGNSNQVGEPLYYIRVEITSATDIVPEIFVVTRKDDSSNKYEYSRVVSLQDIQNYGTSPITNKDGYRVSNFTVTTNSLTFIKEFKEGLQAVVQDLLDSVKNSEQVLDTEQVTTITLTGESY